MFFLPVDLTKPRRRDYGIFWSARARAQGFFGLSFLTAEPV